MQDELHSLRGAIDAGALLDFRTEFERLEPLASGSLDDPLSPGELRLHLEDGIGEASTATITVRWSVQGDYKIHYSDGTDRNLRWDVHPHDYTTPASDAHYHPPPNASSDDDDVDPSCTSVTELVLVARAVHQLWRARVRQWDSRLAQRGDQPTVVRPVIRLWELPDVNRSWSDNGSLTRQPAVPPHQGSDGSRH